MFHQYSNPTLKNVPKRPHLEVAIFKPLPLGYRKSKHYYFYGWAVTDEILKAYLIKQNIPVPRDSLHADVCAIQDLEQRSGYGFINLVGGKVNEEAKAQGRVVRTEEDAALDVLAISCTRSHRLFWRRPTPRQLNILIELLGEEPRWFEDSETKENFEMSLME